jgi:hypothetical protein
MTGRDGAAIASSSRRRWPTEAMPRSLRSSVVNSATQRHRCRCRGIPVRIVRARARAATPRLSMHASVICRSRVSSKRINDPRSLEIDAIIDHYDFINSRMICHEQHYDSQSRSRGEGAATRPRGPTWTFDGGRGCEISYKEQSVVRARSRLATSTNAFMRALPGLEG